MKQPFAVSPCTARLGWKYNSFLSSVLLNFLPLLLFSGQALRAAVAMEGAVRNEMAWHFVPFCKLHKIKMNLSAQTRHALLWDAGSSLFHGMMAGCRQQCSRTAVPSPYAEIRVSGGCLPMVTL